MRVLLTICVFAGLLASVWSLASNHVAEENQPATCTQSCSGLASENRKVSTSISIDRYVDSDYGFTLGVPAGWSKIVLGEFDEPSETTPRDKNTSLWSEPGYAVGFESPRSNKQDRFADYILIEVLPGEDTGLFTTTKADERILSIGERAIRYEKLLIDSDLDQAVDVDLVIFQRGVQALGYTLAFYAIGEPANEQVLFDAFQIMLRTYSQTSDPFVII